MRRHEFYAGTVQRRRLVERRETGWGVVNSSLLRGERSFNSSFKRVIPAGYENLKDYIESELEGKKGEAVGLELGGIGSQLFYDFPQGFFRRTFGVTLVDNRRVYPVLNERNNHQVVEGDVFSSSTVERVGRLLPGGTADLIIERMDGGLVLVPPQLGFLNRPAAGWYSRLAEGGIAFVQFMELPEKHERFLKQWCEYVQTRFGGVLELDFDWDDAVFRMKRLPGAPETFPVLDAEGIRESLRRVKV